MFWDSRILQARPNRPRKTSSTCCRPGSLAIVSKMYVFTFCESSGRLPNTYSKSKQSYSETYMTVSTAAIAFLDAIFWATPYLAILPRTSQDHHLSHTCTLFHALSSAQLYVSHKAAIKNGRLLIKWAAKLLSKSFIILCLKEKEILLCNCLFCLRFKLNREE